MDKKELRKEMRQLRDSIFPEVRAKNSEAIYNKLINSEYYNKARLIFTYVSFGSEVDTHKIINHALSSGKIVCVPKVLGRSAGMKAVSIRSLEELNEGTFGVLEPDSLTNEIDPGYLDLILIPGLAFDKKGGRLGYGAGYYDNFLKSVKAEADKVALAHSLQFIEKVPMEEHDMYIDNILTE